MLHGDAAKVMRGIERQGSARGWHIEMTVNVGDSPGCALGSWHACILGGGQARPLTPFDLLAIDCDLAYGDLLVAGVGGHG